MAASLAGGLVQQTASVPVAWSMQGIRLPLLLRSSAVSSTLVKDMVAEASQKSSLTHFMVAGHSVIGRPGEGAGSRVRGREGEAAPAGEAGEAGEAGGAGGDGQQTPPWQGTPWKQQSRLCG